MLFSSGCNHWLNQIDVNTNWSPLQKGLVTVCLGFLFICKAATKLFRFSNKKHRFCQRQIDFIVKYHVYNVSYNPSFHLIRNFPPILTIKNSSHLLWPIRLNNMICLFVTYAAPLRDVIWRCDGKNPFIFNTEQKVRYLGFKLQSY